MTAEQKKESAYLGAYRRAVMAMQAIESKIHDLPAPEGEIPISWGNVGEMLRIAAELEEIADR